MATPELAESSNDSGPPGACPVTGPPSPPFVPPSRYPATVGPGLWFGTEKLWTYLAVDGTWRGCHITNPQTQHSETSSFWWRWGYDWRTENPPKLNGRRLDASAPPLVACQQCLDRW